MIIEVSTSGGFAGIPAAGISKTIDLDALSIERRREICAVFHPETLLAQAKGALNEGVADLSMYQITISDDDGAPQVFNLREDQLSAEMLDLIDSF